MASRPDPTETDRERPHRPVRSFVRREGRLTAAQERALTEFWPRYGLDAPAQPYALDAVFARRAPVVFEIGFGNGDYLLARAQSEPEKNFIGAEVHRPGVGRVLNHIETAQLSNLRVVCHDAVEVLCDWLQPGALSQVVIYFPDPWHKTRHHKRRLIQPVFVDVLARALRPGGSLLLATDWAHYAEQMREVLNAHPAFVNLAADGGYVSRPPERPLTRFEARGLRLGHTVFDLSYQRRA